MLVCETQRLRLRWITTDDAAFIMNLLNDPDWVRFVGDQNSHNLTDARTSISERFVVSSLKDGFGFLSEHRHQGYAFEATQACLKIAKEELQIERILAITEAENGSSIRLLEKLGLSFEKTIDLNDETLQLYAATL